MEPTNENDVVQGKQTSDDDDISHLSSSLTGPSPPASTLRRRINSLREIEDAKITFSGKMDGLGRDSVRVDSVDRDEEKKGSIVTTNKDDRVGDSVSVSFRGNRNGLCPELDRVASAQVESVGGDEDKDGEKEGSTVTTDKDDRVGDSVADSISQLGGDSGSSGWLLCIAAFVVKAIGFQFNLFVNVIMLVVDPFRLIRLFLMKKLVSLCKFVIGTIYSFVSDWLKDHNITWKLMLRAGWGLLWGIYVGVILCGLLVVSIIVSGFLMRFLVEKPLQLKRDLNFDYTKNSPVAYVPIRSCPCVGCGVNCKVGSTWGSGPRVIPRNHQVEVFVSLTLPESEYNRNLGMFQVRVEFLSADGKTLFSKSQPCMLKFKSQPVQLVTTVLKVAPLVTGYVSESQKLQLKITGFTEGKIPTSCFKVTIEQRAEFQPGAGIPEIYDASLSLESELPFFKRIVWNWKKIVFIWITIVSFLVGLILTLVFCRTLIIHRGRERFYQQLGSK